METINYAGRTAEGNLFASLLSRAPNPASYQLIGGEAIPLHSVSLWRGEESLELFTVPVLSPSQIVSATPAVALFPERPGSFSSRATDRTANLPLD